MNIYLTKFLFTSVLLIYFETNFTLHQKAKNSEDDGELPALEVYESLHINSLSFRAFEMAYLGYLKLKEQNKLEKESILTVIDFTKSSKEKRLFVIDLEAKKMLFNELVAHGMNTGADYAKYFSNNRHSNQSSLGFFVTGEPYKGKKGYSLKLYGLEKNFNDLAFERGVVMHGADYVSEKFIKQNGRLGRSFGCTAVSQEVNSFIINAIKGGSCLFIYYPDKNYLGRSKLINDPDYPKT